jgi:hypothetical protein
MRKGFVGILLFSALSVLVLAGCAKQLVCGPPSVIIGNSCCFDEDKDNVCDAAGEEKVVDEKPAVVEEETLAAVPEEVGSGSADDSDAGSFADTFAGTWNRKSYTALRNLFVDDLKLKFSSSEFNFIARKIDASEGIRSVSFEGMDGDNAEYLLAFADRKVSVYARVVETDGGYRHEPFYFFTNMSADAACGSDGSCFMSFAVISGDQNYCKKTGSLKAECIEAFGVSKTITAQIDTCMAISEYYTRVECLNKVAVAENNPEPCWQATYDKQIFECMGKIAAARENVDECPKLVESKGYAGTRLQDTYCILSYVKETHDLDACAKIDRRDDVVLGSLQEGCYYLRFP